MRQFNTLPSKTYTEKFSYLPSSSSNSHEEQVRGLLWWPNGYYSTLLMQGAGGWSLARELRSYMLSGQNTIDKKVIYKNKQIMRSKKLIQATGWIQFHAVSTCSLPHRYVHTNEHPTHKWVQLYLDTFNLSCPENLPCGPTSRQYSHFIFIFI